MTNYGRKRDLSMLCILPTLRAPSGMMLRLTTPREGMRVTTIRSTPGAVVMLWFAAATLILAAILCAIDIYVLHHRFRDPLELYHAALFAPPFIIMFTGAFLADRIAKAQKSKNAPDEDDGIE